MMDLKRLKEPFENDDIEWRIQRIGVKDGKTWAICVAFINLRAIMDRLDDIIGVGGWKNEYAPGPCGGVICGISIHINDEWVTKWDGADNTEVESVKGGLTGAMKRAAVQWGIGRYLYDLDTSFVKISNNGKYKQPGKPGQYDSFRWNPPDLPKWALPSMESNNNNNIQNKINEAIKAFAKQGIDQRSLEIWLGYDGVAITSDVWVEKDLIKLRECMKKIMKFPPEIRAIEAKKFFEVN
jgi:hypothetical protein